MRFFSSALFFGRHTSTIVPHACGAEIQSTWRAVFRGLGINILYPGDFSGDGHPSDPGPIRSWNKRRTSKGARRSSDKDFLNNLQRSIKKVYLS